MVAHQAPLSMGSSRQAYWSGLPCPLPGDLPNPDMEPGSPTLHANSLSSEPPGKPVVDIPIQKDSVGHHLDLREDHKSACSSSVRKEWNFTVQKALQSVEEGSAFVSRKLFTIGWAYLSLLAKPHKPDSSRPVSLLRAHLHPRIKPNTFTGIILKLKAVKFTVFYI